MFALRCIIITPTAYYQTKIFESKSRLGGMITPVESAIKQLIILRNVRLNIGHQSSSKMRDKISERNYFMLKNVKFLQYDRIDIPLEILIYLCEG